MKDSLRCYECGLVVANGKQLIAPHPFMPGYEVDGCPSCRSIDSMRQVCEVRGCRNESTMGVPVAKIGYRRLCSNHGHKLWKKEQP